VPVRHIKPRIEPNAEVARRRCGRCDGAPGSLKPVAHKHDRVLVFLEASSKARAARGSKRRRLRYSTGWGQPGDDAASPGRGYPATEGTSGAAERAPLRGGTREAALSQRVPRKRRPRETRIASAAPVRHARERAPQGALPRRRQLQPALDTGGDKRCPSRSGWGEALFRERSR
jgi:hypothetical protein